MSIKQMTKVFNDKSLKPTKKLIMLSIADNANEEGFCYPSIKTVCEKTGLTKPTIIKGIKELEAENKLISKKRHRKNGTATSKIYVIYPLENMQNMDEEIKEMFIKKGGQSKAALPTPQSKAALPPKGGQSKAALPLEPSLNTFNHHLYKKENIELPDWLDKSYWNSWTKHRKEIKKPLTPEAIKKQLKFLEKHRYEQEEIIDQSIQSGWSGLFEIKKTKQYKSLAQRNDEAIDKYLAAYSNEGVIDAELN